MRAPGVGSTTGSAGRARGRRRALRRAAQAAAVLAVLAAGCAREAETPEARVRAVLAELTSAAEARDADAMKAHVSEAYTDAQGNDEAGVAGLVRFHFLRHRTVHLLTRVQEVSVAPSGDEARAEALVAMAGTPIPGADALRSLHADLYRFHLTLREEGDGAWRIVRADWRPASLDDFR